MKLFPRPTILHLVVLIAVLVSCDKESDSFSGSTNSGFPTPPPVTNSNSVLSSVGVTDKVFYFLGSSTYPISCNTTYCTKRTRYILHSDGSFLLQYNYDNGDEYRRGIQYKGQQIQINNDVSFTWEGWSIAGPWSATGTFRGDTLTVGYNTIMTLSDFEDAVYLRK